MRRSPTAANRSRARGMWHRLRPRTVRGRLTLLYGTVVLVSGSLLLTIAFVFGAHGTQNGIFIARRAASGAPVKVGGPAKLGPLQQVVTGAAPGGGTASGNITYVTGQNGVPRALSISIADAQFAAKVGSAKAVHNLLWWSGVSLVIVTTLGLLLGSAMSERMLRPLRHMAHKARRISEQNLDERLAVGGPVGDELKDLGDTIDALLGRLEHAFDAQGRFVQNASHELRTPLAMMRTSLEVATGKPAGTSPEVTTLAAKLGEGLDLAERLVESFLLLARAQHGAPAERTRVDLAEAVDGALAAHAGTVEARGLRVCRDLAESPVAGSETLLLRLVANLVDNAVRHNEDDGFLAVSSTSDDTTVRLVVENGGPPLADEEVAALGQPFRRLGTERVAPARGVGLGLSIAAAIAHAHGGGLVLAPREGGGLSAIATLPRARLEEPVGVPA